MELIRSLESNATALITCDKSVVMEANQFNFMELVAHLRDPTLLSDQSIFNIPNERTFMDYDRIRFDIDPPGRYWWDTTVTSMNPRDSGTASFARFQLKTPGPTSASTSLIGQWKDGKSIVQNLLFIISGRITELVKSVQELREMYTHLSLLLPLQCCISNPFQEIDQVTAYYNELFEHLKKQDSTTLLFQRRQDKLKELNSHTLHTPVCVMGSLEDSKDTPTYVQQHEMSCQCFINEYLSIPYSYNLIDVFLFDGVKVPKEGLDKMQATEKKSFTFKMNELATEVLKAIKVLVRPCIQFNINNCLL